MPKPKPIAERKTNPGTQLDNRSIGCSWAAYAKTHYPEEYTRALKKLPPSPEFAAIADKGLTFVHGDGNLFTSIFPLSLHMSTGQKFWFACVAAIEKLTRQLPRRAYEKWMSLPTVIASRRAESRRMVSRIAHAALHRAAFEGKQEVIFAYDSIRIWVEQVYHESPTNQQIRTSLKVLEATGFFRIEWAIANYRGRATHIHTLLSPVSYADKADAEAWVEESAYAMGDLYRREAGAAEANRMDHDLYRATHPLTAPVVLVPWSADRMGTSSSVGSTTYDDLDLLRDKGCHEPSTDHPGEQAAGVHLVPATTSEGDVGLLVQPPEARLVPVAPGVEGETRAGDEPPGAQVPLLSVA